MRFGLKFRPLIDEKDAFREIAGLKPRPDEHPGSARRRLIAAMAENALPQLKPEPVETGTSTGNALLLEKAQRRLHEATDEDYIAAAKSIVSDPRGSGR